MSESVGKTPKEIPDVTSQLCEFLIVLPTQITKMYSGINI